MSGLYEKYPVPREFKSDGCTIPWFLAFMIPFFAPYKNACRWHDWARRHLVHYGALTVQDADRGFHQYLIARGAYRWFARAAWFFVKVTRSKYRQTHPIPDESWADYLKEKQP